MVVGGVMRNRLHGLFDNEWAYDAGAGRVHELIAFERKLKLPAQG